MAGELSVRRSVFDVLLHVYCLIRVGWDLGLGYAPGPHSPRFREFRRLFHQLMGPRSSQDPRLLLAQEKNAERLLRRLLDKPNDFITHVRQ